MAKIENRYNTETKAEDDLPTVKETAVAHKADLTKSALCDADLRNADLSYADLSGADLSYADLRNADLSYAVLRNAYLSDADLRNADLSYADLSYAVLRNAYLSGADLRNANLPAYQIPQEGELIVWKALANGILAELCVPSTAKRTASIVGRKCRAEFVTVLGLYDVNGTLLPENTVGVSKYESHTKYTTGKEVQPDHYDNDFRVECTNGIHFWLTFDEAVVYL